MQSFLKRLTPAVLISEERIPREKEKNNMVGQNAEQTNTAEGRGGGGLESSPETMMREGSPSDSSWSSAFPLGSPSSWISPEQRKSPGKRSGGGGETVPLRRNKGDDGVGARIYMMLFHGFSNVDFPQHTIPF